jgi:hypothetical protein
VTLVSNGLRVGYSPVEFQLFVTQPNRQRQIGAFPAELVLDPSVLLVPVQVFVLFSTEHPKTTSLSEQLALWDRVPTVTQRTVLDEPGQLDAVVSFMSNWVQGGEGLPGNAGLGPQRFILPDDVWCRCKIQFRLVNYTELQLDDASVSPKDTGQGLQAPLLQNLRTIRAHQNFIQNVPTMVFTSLCTPFGVAPLGTLFTPTGITLPGQAIGCVSMASPQRHTIVHELSHLILDTSDHAVCVQGDYSKNNVMCETGGAQVIDEQCSSASSHIRSQKWSELFPRH